VTAADGITRTTERERRRQLAGLRSQWRTWNRGGPHPAFALICPDRCGDCEACAMTAYRADRMAELTALARALTPPPRQRRPENPGLERVSKPDLTGLTCENTKTKITTHTAPQGDTSAPKHKTPGQTRQHHPTRQR
jgi:hypothetical protein